ncbi:MAG: Asp-tRNA(Asn)/Glu-tRNA(Gln) amidotransferase subunit GatB, partial [Eubacteriales bacterium]|nr:Asp-tRNA(Asn)/Glu-tRNA(Gln) amidotransferase subunit GatB [Eubacteriales bacterium]
TKDGLRKIAIKGIHIEEDAGKVLHDLYESETVVDYNRAGVPLIEIVTEPDLRTPEEVVEFLQEVMNTLSNLGISDCRMQEGSLRVDVNISIRAPEALRDPEALKGSDGRSGGNRIELKNLNSFKAMKRAIAVEVKRQSEIIKSGGKVARETRRWDEASGKTVQMRDKEDIEDYRYFPEPDLPQLLLDRTWVGNIRGRMPELPSMKKERFMLEYGLPEYDAAFISSDRLTADFFEEAAALCHNAKALSNWIMGEVTRLKKELQPEKNELPFTPAKLVELIAQIDKGIINSQNAKDVLRKMFITGQAPVEIVREEGLRIIKDEQRLNEIILKVLKNNPKSVADYRAGRKKAAGFLMGKIMKETGGMADAEITIGLLEKSLRQSRDSM